MNGDGLKSLVVFISYVTVSIVFVMIKGWFGYLATTHPKCLIYDLFN